MNREERANTPKLWTVLHRSTMAVGQNMGEHIKSLGICDSDFAVLEVLLHKGALPVNLIGNKVLLTSGSITVAIDRLEQKGFVERKPHPDDRRSHLVHLTKRGNRFIDEAFDDHEKIIEDVFSILSNSEKIQLHQLLKKLGYFAQTHLEEKKSLVHHYD